MIDAQSLENCFPSSFNYPSFPYTACVKEKEILSMLSCLPCNGFQQMLLAFNPSMRPRALWNWESVLLPKMIASVIAPAEGFTAAWNHAWIRPPCPSGCE